MSDTETATNTAQDTANEAQNATSDVAQGGRNTATNAVSSVANTAQGFTKKDAEDMGGSLKIHIKINLEVDVRIIAKVKGDILIGIL